MSHYTVLVTRTNHVPLDEQLEPFDENITVEPYLRPCYCIGRAARQYADSEAPKQLGKSVDDFRKEWAANPPSWKASHTWADFIKPLTDLLTKLEQEHPGYQKPNPGCGDCEGGGKRPSTYNPDSKWDWYVVGGRWRGYLKLNPGAEGELGDPGAFDKAEPKPGRADIAKAKDIDWQAMREQAKAAAERSWQAYQEKLAKGDEANAAFWLDVEDNDTKETYIARRSSVATYAVLHNGKWHATGEMGWFGMSNDAVTVAEWDETFTKLIESLDPDDEVTVVDCHI